jgi:hypothetical protein
VGINCINLSLDVIQIRQRYTSVNGQLHRVPALQAVNNITALNIEGVHFWIA